MKFRIIVLMMCMSSITYTQTPSKPTNPFPRKTTPAPTTKPTTQIPPPGNNIPTPIPNAPVIINNAPTDVKVNQPTITGTDEEQIMTIISMVFYAMKMGDSSLLRPLFSPAAILYTASSNATGQNTLTQESISNFIQSVGTPRKEVIDERILKYKLDIDGPLAQVWADYNLYVGNKFYHCGVDIFQLFKSPDGWKIFELADTRRKIGCSADPKDDISTFLDKWHADAAAANADAYFGAMTTDGVFLGTDASERWTREEFRIWAKPQFDSKKAWSFKPIKRNISLTNDNTFAWFDEDLSTWMGPCRGSGVLVKTVNGWKIKQYNLTILVPNEKLQSYLKVIGMK